MADLKQFRTVTPKAPKPTVPNKSRGRSQSIAVCAQNGPLLPFKSKLDGAPIIKTTDCDHEASLMARTSSLGTQAEECEPEQSEETDDAKVDKLLWDSCGSTVDVGLLGSVIETYLKTSAEDDTYDQHLNDLEEDLAEETEGLNIT